LGWCRSSCGDVAFEEYGDLLAVRSLGKMGARLLGVAG